MGGMPGLDTFTESSLRDVVYSLHLTFHCAVNCPIVKSGAVGFIPPDAIYKDATSRRWIVERKW